MNFSGVIYYLFLHWHELVYNIWNRHLDNALCDSHILTFSSRQKKITSPFENVDRRANLYSR